VGPEGETESLEARWCSCERKCFPTPPAPGRGLDGDRAIGEVRGGDVPITAMKTCRGRGILDVGCQLKSLRFLGRFRNPSEE
jgi:hypothetical protein